MKKAKWVQAFSVLKDGFHGHLYDPEVDQFKGKTLLVLGGGGVPYSSTMDIALAFSQLGIRSLALGYFGVKDTPKTIVKVPVEYVKKAVFYLHEAGAEKVIVTGISKGAELALVSASLIKEINGVIALSPPSRIYMAVGSGISWLNASSWTYQKKELPYAYAYASGIQALRDSLKAGELTFRPVYEKANQQSSSNSLIAVEKIQGPVLVVASTSDSLWPSDQACHEMIQRLKVNHFAYPYKELVYEYASHLLLPFETAYGKLFKVGRTYPDKCKETVYELQMEVLKWLELC